MGESGMRGEDASPEVRRSKLDRRDPGGYLPRSPQAGTATVTMVLKKWPLVEGFDFETEEYSDRTVMAGTTTLTGFCPSLANDLVDLEADMPSPMAEAETIGSSWSQLLVDGEAAAVPDKMDAAEESVCE